MEVCFFILLYFAMPSCWLYDDYAIFVRLIMEFIVHIYFFLLNHVCDAFVKSNKDKKFIITIQKNLAESQKCSVLTNSFMLKNVVTSTRHNTSNDVVCMSFVTMVVECGCTCCIMDYHESCCLRKMWFSL